jgi:Fur family ferric uptake transcriptional regulator
MTATSIDRLRSAGLRVTAPRLAVLDALADHPHGDVDVIARAVRTRLGAVSTQAVYDILRALTGARLARRIEPAGGPARYETRVGDNHHHVVCRRCGATTDVDCAVGAAPCLEPSADEGFLIDEAEITFWGSCPSCQAGSASPGPLPDSQLDRAPRRTERERA